MLIVIIILVLLLGSGGGYYGHSRWGYGGGAGVGLGTILLILLVVYLLGGFRWDGARDIENMVILTNALTPTLPEAPQPPPDKGLDSTVLSLGFDVPKLRLLEAAIRAGGFDVVSVTSGILARFEIEMGRCGVFLTCDHVPTAANRELIGLFRRNCSRGWVILVTTDDNADHLEADVWVRESNEPKGIVESLRSRVNI
jgi:hypothetical protein